MARDARGLLESRRHQWSIIYHGGARVREASRVKRESGGLAMSAHGVGGLESQVRSRDFHHAGAECGSFRQSEGVSEIPCNQKNREQ